MIKGINEKIKTELVEPAKFFADMNKMYLSKYLIDVLRNYYTEKERKKLNKNKKNTSVGLMECESDWPICLENIVMNNYYHKSPSFYLYRSSSILENFKPEHFPKKRKQIKKNIVDRASVRDASGMELHSPVYNLFESEVQQADIKVSEKQLLIERTKHICKYGCDTAIEKREHERKKKQMMFKIDVASRKRTKKRDSSSLARLSSRNSQEISTINFFNPDEIKHKDRKRGSRDDISLDFSLREPLSVKVGLRSTLILILALPKRGDIEGEISNTSKITKEEALEKVKVLKKAQNHLATSSISQSQTDKNRISDAKPSILSRINPLNLFRKKQPTEILRPLEINVNQNNESPEMSDDEDKDHKNNEVTIEIESDEDDDARHPERDIVRRITLLKMQFDKVGVEDDLDFGEMFKSLVVRNVNKFDLPDTYH